MNQQHDFSRVKDTSTTLNERLRMLELALSGVAKASLLAKEEAMKTAFGTLLALASQQNVEIGDLRREVDSLKLSVHHMMKRLQIIEGGGK